jgi:hypothetical protein
LAAFWFALYRRQLRLVERIRRPVAQRVRCFPTPSTVRLIECSLAHERTNMNTQILAKNASTTFLAALVAGAAIVTAGLVYADEQAYKHHHVIDARPAPVKAQENAAPVQLEPIEVVGHRTQKIAAAQTVVLPSIEIVGHAADRRFA